MYRYKKKLLVKATNLTNCTLKVKEVIGLVRANYIDLIGIYDGYECEYEPRDVNKWKVTIRIYYNIREE